ncbi:MULTISPECIES: Gfo/Idh/MocA family oxidoreductase [unclassified Lysinibacillus]|uniref:Gfo/Idh/MocA family oxidoreductase n=1 Tax=unclassified Lysinibacillus TaxID=2636778 RepID=UPI00382B704C
MLKTAVIGLGRLGRWHAINMLNIREIEIVSVCDHTLEVAQSVASELNIPHFTDNVDVIMANDAIQAVVIVTSTSTHYDIILKAISAKKAIFVEKPLTIDMDESISIQQQVKQTNAFCQVGFMRRFDSDYVEAKKIIDAGGIGIPLYFKGISRDPIAPEGSFISRSGGLFIDMCIHDYDLARFLMGDEVKAVSAFGSNIKYPELAQYGDVDQGLTYLQFANGAAGDIEGSRCAYYGYDIRTEVIGSEGTLLIGSSRKNNVNILTKQGNTHEIIPAFPQRFEAAYVNELSAFAHAVINRKPSPVTVDDSLKALKIAYAATASFNAQGKTHTVEL